MAQLRVGDWFPWLKSQKMTASHAPQSEACGAGGLKMALPSTK